MTFTEHPLFVLDDPANIDDVRIAMTATGGHHHLIAIGDMHAAYLQQHMILHLTALDEGEVHRRCLDNIDLLQEWAVRGMAAMWS